MLTETISYVDYNGVSRKENFYFNLTHAELAELEMGTTGGFGEMLQKIIDTQDGPAIVKIFKDFILKAYGEKSDDGRRFMKSKEISDGFAQTEAYSVLFMKLATDAEAASKFIISVIPDDLREQAATHPAKA